MNAPHGFAERTKKQAKTHKKADIFFSFITTRRWTECPGCYRWWDVVNQWTRTVEWTTHRWKLHWPSCRTLQRDSCCNLNCTCCWEIKGRSGKFTEMWRVQFCAVCTRAARLGSRTVVCVLRPSRDSILYFLPSIRHLNTQFQDCLEETCTTLKIDFPSMGDGSDLVYMCGPQGTVGPRVRLFRLCLCLWVDECLTCRPSKFFLPIWVIEFGKFQEISRREDVKDSFDYDDEGSRVSPQSLGFLSEVYRTEATKTDTNSDFLKGRNGRFLLHFFVKVPIFVCPYL